MVRKLAEAPDSLIEALAHFALDAVLADELRRSDDDHRDGACAHRRPPAAARSGAAPAAGHRRPAPHCAGTARSRSPRQPADSRRGSCATRAACSTTSRRCSRRCRPSAAPGSSPGATVPLPQAARRVHRLRRELAALARARAALAEEQALLLQYRGFFEAFDPLLERTPRWPDARASFVLLRAGAGASVAQLEKRLRSVAGAQVEMHARPLPSGETAVLLLAAGARRRRSKACSPRRGSTSCRHRAVWARPNLLRAMPALRARLAEIDTELLANDARRAEIAAQAAPRTRGAAGAAARPAAAGRSAGAGAHRRAAVRHRRLAARAGAGAAARTRRARARSGSRGRQGGHRAVDPRRRAGRARQSAAVPAVRADHPRVSAAALRLDRSDAVRRRVLPDVLRPDDGRRRLRLAARRHRRGRALALAPRQQRACGRRDGAGLRAVRDRVRRAVRRVLRFARCGLRHAARWPSTARSRSRRS